MILIGLENSFGDMEIFSYLYIKSKENLHINKLIYEDFKFEFMQDPSYSNTFPCEHFFFIWFVIKARKIIFKNILASLTTNKMIVLYILIIFYYINFI